MDKEIDKLKLIGDKSDWVDLRAAEDVELKAGEFRKIRLGVAMELPAGYEAMMIPRGSTFEKLNIIQTNSMGLFDNTFKGDNDEWLFPALTKTDTVIKKNDRICQFRIIENQPELNFEEVEYLDNQDRGCFGSTGQK